MAQHDKVDVYRRIAAAAALAPSAENTQPWRFVVDGDELTVCLDTARTLASDIDHLLSLTAIGACIENAVVAASGMGYRCGVEYLAASAPTQSEPPVLPVARLRFSEGASRDPLADCIESRCTCRRMDARRPVEASLLTELQRSGEVCPGVEVHWVDRRRLRQFGELIGMGYRIRLEYEPFHRELYDNLRFSAEEAERTRDGLDVATLQLPRATVKVLGLLRTWARMKWANKFGFSRTVARQAAQEVRQSGAVGLVTVSAPGRHQFVDGGRGLERIWLTATRLGLCFHPTASLPVFLAYDRSGSRELEPRHAKLAADMSERFHALFPELAGRIVQMAFRIGYGPPPPVRSLRRPANASLEVK